MFAATGTLLNISTRFANDGKVRPTDFPCADAYLDNTSVSQPMPLPIIAASSRIRHLGGDDDGPGPKVNRKCARTSGDYVF